MDYREDNRNSELYALLETLPKIELHRHLEGSLRLSTLADIAREHKLDRHLRELASYEIEDLRPLVQVMPEDERNMDSFLAKFKNLRQFYRSPEFIDRVAYEAVADAALENIVYMELRFTPIALSLKMGFSLLEASKWVVKAVKRAQKEFDIDVRLLVSMNRHESVELGDQAVDVAIKLMDQGVVGVDIAGNEAKFSGVPFEPVFRKARDAGLAVTVHAGEWAGPESVGEAVNILGATRLGHGVRIIQDSEMVRMARERQIAFEVCPTSNVQTGVAHNFAQHPLRDMYQVGLVTTINTDDPSVEGINLTDELVHVIEHLDFTLDDVKQHILNSAQVAFLPPNERKRLIGRLTTELDAIQLPAALSRKAS